MDPTLLSLVRHFYCEVSKVYISPVAVDLARVLESLPPEYRSCVSDTTEFCQIDDCDLFFEESHETKQRFLFP